MWGNQLGCGRSVEERKCSTTLPRHGANVFLHEQAERPAHKADCVYWRDTVESI